MVDFDSLCIAFVSLSWNSNCFVLIEMCRVEQGYAFGMKEFGLVYGIEWIMQGDTFVELCMLAFEVLMALCVAICRWNVLSWAIAWKWDIKYKNTNMTFHNIIQQLKLKKGGK